MFFFPLLLWIQFETSYSIWSLHCSFDYSLLHFLLGAKLISRRRHQCSSGEEHLRLFTHIGHVFNMIFTLRFRLFSSTLYFGCKIDKQTSAPKFLRGRTSSACYTHRTRTSTMFVKKRVEIHSVAYLFLFEIFLYINTIQPKE